MTNYRCYRLDQSQRIINRDTLDAAFDLEAVAAAHELASQQHWIGFEVWDVERLVYPVSDTRVQEPKH